MSSDRLCMSGRRNGWRAEGERLPRRGPQGLGRISYSKEDRLSSDATWTATATLRPNSDLAVLLEADASAVVVQASGRRCRLCGLHTAQARRSRPDGHLQLAGQPNTPRSVDHETRSQSAALADEGSAPALRTQPPCGAHDRVAVPTTTGARKYGTHRLSPAVHAVLISPACRQPYGLGCDTTTPPRHEVAG